MPPLFIGLILISFLGLSLKRFHLALGAILFLLPLYTVKLSIFKMPVTLLDAMIIISFIVFFFDYKIYRLSYLKKVFDNVKFKILLGVIVLAVAISVFVAPDLKTALGIWKSYFIEAIVFYIMFVNVVRKKRQIESIVLFLGLSALSLSIYAIVQHFTKFGIPSPYGYEDPSRVTSVFPYPVALVLYLGPIIGIYLGLLSGKIAGKLKEFIPFWFVLLVLVSSILAAYWTYSRGFLIALLIAVLAVSYFAWDNKKLKWGVVAIVLLVSILIFTIPGLSERFVSVFTGDDNSTNVRLVMWQGTWRLIKAHPIFGAGLSGFPSLYDQYREARHIELLKYPHNIILNFWVELGIIGLASFIWLFVLVFKLIFEKLKKVREKIIEQDYKFLLLGLLAAFIMIIVHGMIDVPYFKNDLAVMFWGIIGLLVVIGADTLQSEKKKDQKFEQK